MVQDLKQNWLLEGFASLRPNFKETEELGCFPCAVGSQPGVYIGEQCCSFKLVNIVQI